MRKFNHVQDIVQSWLIRLQARCHTGKLFLDAPTRFWLLPWHVYFDACHPRCFGSPDHWYESKWQGTWSICSCSSQTDSFKKLNGTGGSSPWLASWPLPLFWTLNKAICWSLKKAFCHPCICRHPDTNIGKLICILNINTWIWSTRGVVRLKRRNGSQMEGRQQELGSTCLVQLRRIS